MVCLCVKLLILAQATALDAAWWKKNQPVLLALGDLTSRERGSVRQRKGDLSLTCFSGTMPTKNSWRSWGATRRAEYRRRTYHVIYTSCKKLHFEIKLIPVFHCITGSLGHSTWWWWENIRIQGHIDITKSPLIEVALTGVWREWRGIRQESCHQQQLNIWPEENQSDKSEADWCTRLSYLLAVISAHFGDFSPPGPLGVRIVACCCRFMVLTTGITNVR